MIKTLFLTLCLIKNKRFFNEIKSKFSMKIKVYTEYLLKKLKVTLWVQNIYFYLNSIAFNVIILLFRSEDMTLEGFKRPGVIAMTVNLAGKN